LGWEFSTDPEFQAKLDWTDTFVREEVEPLDLLWGTAPFIPSTTSSARSSTPEATGSRAEAVGVPPRSRARGRGVRQVKLSLMNEILGRSRWAPIIFGCQAPDTGNAEIIAHYGTDEQKERYLRRCSTARSSRRTR